MENGALRFANAPYKLLRCARIIGAMRFAYCALLDPAQSIDDMDVPGFGLHALKGRMKGRWAISVSGNWRLTFEFKNGNVHVLDYEDYHK